AGASAARPAVASSSSLGGAVGTLDRGGALPVLSASGGGSASTVLRGTVSSSSELETMGAPSRAPLARSDVSSSALALEKRPAGPPPATDEDLDEDLGLEAVPEGEASSAEALGPDKAYDRYLSGPAPGAGKDRAERTVYVPPDPSKPPAELAQSDIFEVVLANKGDITTCAREQQEAAGEGGRVVLRWNILPSGKVSEVVTETSALKGTPLARCIEDKVRGWTFPKHQEQGGPVRFPFVF
ncbi:AgmX/PglI C-terminal domain-containing protein, partial [Pyxidicoccus sp. 3LG]